MTVLSTLSDLSKLAKTVVVIDVFRASNTIIEALHKGADRVLVVESLLRAQQLKREHPEWVVLGERAGIKVDGLDGDNSPAGMSSDVKGNTVVLTTSGGAKCVGAVPRECEVLIGSFGNALEISRLLINKLPDEISFWAVGEKAEVDADEDVACAKFLENVQRGADPDFGRIQSTLENCVGASRLKKLGQTDDLALCLQFSSRAIIPFRESFSDGISEIKIKEVE